MDLRINNGVPEWSARGADTWSPFKSGADIVYVIGGNGTSHNIEHDSEFARIISPAQASINIVKHNGVQIPMTNQGHIGTGGEGLSVSDVFSVKKGDLITFDRISYVGFYGVLVY